MDWAVSGLGRLDPHSCKEHLACILAVLCFQGFLKKANAELLLCSQGEHKHVMSAETTLPNGTHTKFEAISIAKGNC